MIDNILQNLHNRDIIKNKSRRGITEKRGNHMIAAKILFLMEIREEHKVVLIIQSKSGVVKVAIYNKAIDLMCEKAKVNDLSELPGKKVKLDPDANYSCIYVYTKKKGYIKLEPISCDISLIKSPKKW